MHSSPAMDRLVKSLKRLPGIGEKSAARLAYHLLSAPDGHVAELSEAIGRLKTDTVVCATCFNLSDRNPCSICADDRRDRALLCVVEEPADLASVESSGGFHGLYHVLGGALSPIDGMGPENLRIEELAARVERGGVTEVILATNPTVEGEATAYYLIDMLQPVGVKLTRIAHGVPLGGELEYVDGSTLAHALSGRRTVD